MNNKKLLFFKSGKVFFNWLKIVSFIEIGLVSDRSERHEFASRFLFVVGKLCCKENAGMGLTIQFLYIN